MDGETWTERSRFPVSATSRLAVAPDGVVYAGLTKRQPDGPIVWRSMDGGRSWEAFDDGYEREYVGDLEVDDRGRLVLSGLSGVWRTRAPVYAVTDERAPDPTAPLAVRLWPTPSGGPVTVSVKLAVPERVTVTVYDVQGREVLAVWDGPATDGQRFSIETAGLAPGAYVVRAASASGAATAGLAVVR